MRETIKKRLKIQIGLGKFYSEISDWKKAMLLNMLLRFLNEWNDEGMPCLLTFKL